jgi:hypothetical protein
MTPEQRTERIKDLAHELSTLLAQEAPRPKIGWLTAADLPGWVAQGLKDALRRKIAEEAPTTH